MKRKYILMFFIILYSGLITLYADEPLTLTEEDAVILGLQQNISLENSLISLESTQAQYKNRWNTFLPDFSISSGITRTEKFLSADSGDNSTDPWGLNISGGLSLTLGFGNSLTMKKKEIELESQELQHESSEKALEVSIRKKFKYLQASKENLSLQQKNIGLAQKRYEQALINFNNGFISELSLLTVQNSVETLKPAYQDADTTYKQQLMSFQNLLGLDLSQKIELQGSLDVQRYEFDSDILVDSFLAKRLDINSSLINIELQKNKGQITKTGNISPTVSLGAQWNNNVNTLFDDPSFIDSTTLSASFKIPINGHIPGSSEYLEIEDANRNLEQSKLALEIAKNDAEEDIRSILMELEGAWANIQNTKLSVQLAKKTYEMTEEAFEKGSSELLDVEDAQNKFLSANQDLLLSKYTYLAGVLDLEYALNTDINNILAASDNSIK